MTDRHVWSAAAGAATGADWANAYPALTTAFTAAAAGDTIYVAHDHAETPGTTTLTSAGTITAPLKVVCGTRTGTGSETGISALATTGALTSTGTVTITGGYTYLYGLILTCGNGSGSSLTFTISGTASVYVYENCQLLIASTGGSSSILLGSTASNDNALTILKNCNWRCGSTGTRFWVNGVLEIEGGGPLSGGSTPVTCFSIGNDGRGGIVRATGVDFSNYTSGFDVATDVSGAIFASFRNCKMPASWSGTPNSATLATGARFELLNYSIGTDDDNYRFWTNQFSGDCKDETTIKRNPNGASDESQGYSIRMASNANCSYPGNVLRSPPIYLRNTSTSAQTATVHIVHDGTTAMNNDEIWLELEYLGTSGAPIASIGNDRRVFTASAAAQTASSETWDGDTGTGPNGQSSWFQLKLDVAFTAAEVGYLIGTVCVAKPGVPTWTVFVDPKIELA